MFVALLFFNDTATTEIYSLSLHDALPISARAPAAARPAAAAARVRGRAAPRRAAHAQGPPRSEEHTSELQSLRHLVCRLLLEKKKRRQPSATRSHSRQTEASTPHTSHSSS